MVDAVCDTVKSGQQRTNCKPMNNVLILLPLSRPSVFRALALIIAIINALCFHEYVFNSVSSISRGRNGPAYGPVGGRCGCQRRPRGAPRPARASASRPPPGGAEEAAVVSLLPEGAPRRSFLAGPGPPQSPQGHRGEVERRVADTDARPLTRGSGKSLRRQK